jgi:hypothetical protein
MAFEAAAVEAETEEAWQDVAIEEEEGEQGEEYESERGLELKLEAIDLDTFVSELRALGGKIAGKARQAVQGRQGSQRHIDVPPAEPAMPAARAVRVPPPLPADVDSGVAEFIAALNAMQTVEGGQPAPEETSEAPEPFAFTPPPPAPERGRRKKRAKATPPAQDEWGMFDPQQCGFAALMAKLDAMNDEDRKEEKKKARSR